jgi:hypothetical protein
MRTPRKESLTRVSVTLDAEALFRRVTSLFRKRPWLSVGLALLLFVVLALIVAPLLSFVLAAAIGAGAYALLGGRGEGSLGRMPAADLAQRRREPAPQTLLFLDLAALVLFGVGLVLLAAADQWNAETLIAFGLGAALVVIARAV